MSRAQACVPQVLPCQSAAGPDPLVAVACPCVRRAAFDAAASFKAEKTAYEAADHDWALADAEEQALALLQRISTASA